MAVNMRFTTNGGSSWTTVDLTESGVYGMKLRASDSAPKTLTWKMGSPQQDEPIPSGAFVQVWEDTGEYESTAFSSSYPTFEGYCRSTPGRDTYTVEYTAYDPTGEAAINVNVFDEDWVDNAGTIQPDSTAVPRAVYNCMNDRDPDFVICKANPFSGQNGISGLTADLTGSVRFFLSEIIADLLNHALLPLRHFKAAPSGTAAYVSADLDVTALQWIPQDKVVIQNETIRSAITRLLANYAPAYKMQFRCGDRKWRFYNQVTGTARTLTLNDYDASQVVLSFWLDKSLDGRATAVELFGPKNFGLSVFDTDTGDLTETDGVTYQYTNASGLQTTTLPNTWQITDADDRPGSRILPAHYFAPLGLYAASNVSNGFTWFYYLVPTRSPTLQASWDGGVSFVTIPNPYWNFREGTVSVGTNNSLYLFKDYDSGPSNQEYFPPDVVRIVYAPFTAPLGVRYPTSGYSGTAYSEEGVVATFRQYHEMLAVGYETYQRYATPTGDPVIGSLVTTEERLNQYKKLAEAIHSQRCNVAWTGGATLDGLQWDYLNLNRRINIAGLDSAGASTTTGWEAINAVLTDVEYDFAEQTTTLMFNSNLLEVAGYPVELLMQQLNIKALERRVSYTSQLHWRFHEDRFSWRKAGHWEWSGVTLTEHVTYVDPDRFPRENWDDGLRLQFDGSGLDYRWSGNMFLNLFGGYQSRGGFESGVLGPGTGWGGMGDTSGWGG